MSYIAIGLIIVVVFLCLSLIGGLITYYDFAKSFIFHKEIKHNEIKYHLLFFPLIYIMYLSASVNDGNSTEPLKEYKSSLNEIHFEAIFVMLMAYMVYLLFTIFLWPITIILLIMSLILMCGRALVP